MILPDSTAHLLSLGARTTDRRIRGDARLRRAPATAVGDRVEHPGRCSGGLPAQPILDDDPLAPLPAPLVDEIGPWEPVDRRLAGLGLRAARVRARAGPGRPRDRDPLPHARAYEQPERRRRGSAATALSSSATSSAHPEQRGRRLQRRAEALCHLFAAVQLATGLGATARRSGELARAFARDPFTTIAALPAARRDAAPAGRRRSEPLPTTMATRALTAPRRAMRFPPGDVARRMASPWLVTARPRPAFVRPDGRSGSTSSRASRSPASDRTPSPTTSSRVESNMALYHGVLALWLQLGSDEAWTRLPSIVFALATLPFLFALSGGALRPDHGRPCRRAAVRQRLVRRLRARRPELRARAAARHGVFLLPRPRSGGHRPRDWAGWALLSALAVWAHLFAALVLVAQIAWMLLERESVPRRRALAAVGGLAALLLPLALAVVLGGQSAQLDWLGRPGVRQVPGLGEWFVESRATLIVYLVGAVAALVARLSGREIAGPTRFSCSGSSRRPRRLRPLVRRRSALPVPLLPLLTARARAARRCRVREASARCGSASRSPRSPARCPCGRSRAAARTARSATTTGRPQSPTSRRALAPATRSSSIRTRCGRRSTTIWAPSGRGFSTRSAGASSAVRQKVPSPWTRRCGRPPTTRGSGS